MKIAVYTFISGSYDSLKPFNENYNKDADFFFFTDSPQTVESGKYQTVIVPVIKGYERYTARLYKMSSDILFPKYDYAIWIDGTTSLEESPRKLVEKYLSDKDIAAFIYPDEDCIYIHADKCIKAGRMLARHISPQMGFYRIMGYPDHAGLCELRVVLRKNTSKVKSLNELWFETYKTWLTCDQLSLNYCLWKLGIEYNTIEWGSPEFKTEGHQEYSQHRYNFRNDDSVDSELQPPEIIKKISWFV